MKQHRYILLPAILLAIGAGEWGCSGTNGKAALDPATSTVTALVVKAALPEVLEWAVAVPVSGSLRSQSIVDVKSEVGGQLIATYFREGDLVRKGQLLAEIDPVNYQLAYDQARAALAVAEAGQARVLVLLDHAKREKERADNLLGTGGITEKDHQAAVTGVKEAETQLRLADAQCAQARVAISVAEKASRDCRILAPSEGHVYKKFFDKGSLLVPGSSIYTLVDNGRLDLECLLPSYRLAEVRLGRRVVFTTPSYGERPFEGLVAAVNPMVESDNRSVRIIVRVANPRGELRSGMYARGAIEIRLEPKALVLPRSALISEEEEPTSGNVYVIQGGQARRRPVRIGGIRQDRIWVQQGLQRDEMVILEIGPSLKEGTPVQTTGNSSGTGH